MPRKKEIDHEKLIATIEAGTPSSEVMKEFGIKTLAQLRSYYADALIAVGRIPGIKSSRGQSSLSSEPKGLKINKRGSLVIPRTLVEEYGFQKGDGFNIRKTKSGIILRRL